MLWLDEKITIPWILHLTLKLCEVLRQRIGIKPNLLLWILQKVIGENYLAQWSELTRIPIFNILNFTQSIIEVNLKQVSL